MGIGNLLNRISGTKWYLRPENLQTYMSVLADKNLSASLLDSRFNKEVFLQTTDFSTYYKEKDVLLLNIDGTLMSKGANLDAECGFMSYNAIRNEIETSDASNIVLAVDSPGGMLYSCKLLADYLYSLRSSRYLVAVNTGMMCSAAYYLSAACDEVFAQDTTVDTGCVGVITCHVDKSALNSAIGLKYTYITSGDLKAAGNADEPLPEEVKNMLQADVNEAADVFFADIQKYRNFTEEQMTVIKRGGSYMSNEALRLGLIDGIKNLHQIMEG